MLFLYSVTKMISVLLLILSSRSLQLVRGFLTTSEYPYDRPETLGVVFTLPASLSEESSDLRWRLLLIDSCVSFCFVGGFCLFLLRTLSPSHFYLSIRWKDVRRDYIGWRRWRSRGVFERKERSVEVEGGRRSIDTTKNVTNFFSFFTCAVSQS